MPTRSPKLTETIICCNERYNRCHGISCRSQTVKYSTFLKNDVLQEIEAVRKREANVVISGFCPTRSSDIELINKLFFNLFLASSEFQSRTIGEDLLGKHKLLLILFENSHNVRLFSIQHTS